MTIGTSLADVATLLLVTCWFRVAAAAHKTTANTKYSLK